MWFRSVFVITIASLSSIAFSATITNDIIGVGPKAAKVAPYICLQNKNGEMTYALAPGKSVDATKYSDNPYYAGAAIRFGGCETSNTYLGYVGIGLGAAPTISYNAPKDVHIIYSKPTISADGHIAGAINYTVIQPNFNLLTSPPAQYTDLNFVGINLSGLEFGKAIDPVVIPNLSVEDAGGQYSDLADTQAFLKGGMNTIRVPISWSFIQLEGAGKGDLNLDYYQSYLKPLIESLTSAHVYTIIDLHAYMRYSIFGKEYSGCGAEGNCPDGTLVTDAKAYEDVWSKLYALMKADPKINMNYVMLDLVNEPVNVPNDAVFTIQASVIKKLREQGFDGYILVEGNNWSGLHSWSNTWNSTEGNVVYSNASLFTRDNFVKAGIADLSKIIVNVHQYVDSDYSGTHNQCLTDLTTIGPDGFNLNEFVSYLKANKLKAMVTEFGAGTDSQSCSGALVSFLDYLQANAAKNNEGGFVGWTIWSAGHGWGEYNLRVTPTSYHMNVLRKYLQPME